MPNQILKVLKKLTNQTTAVGGVATVAGESADSTWAAALDAEASAWEGSDAAAGSSPYCCHGDYCVNYANRIVNNCSKNINKNTKINNERDTLNHIHFNCHSFRHYC